MLYYPKIYIKKPFSDIILINEKFGNENICRGSVQPTMLAIAIQGIEPQRRGAVNGTVFAAFDLGIGIGSLTLGLIANALGFSAMYLLASLSPLIGLGLFLFWPPKN
ncbi:MAG: MFS transporter [Bacillota bacterium]